MHTEQSAGRQAYITNCMHEQAHSIQQRKLNTEKNAYQRCTSRQTAQTDCTRIQNQTRRLTHEKQTKRQHALQCIIAGHRPPERDSDCLSTSDPRAYVSLHASARMCVFVAGKHARPFPALSKQMSGKFMNCSRARDELARTHARQTRDFV